MANDREKANKLREEGNRQFTSGNFVAAEGLYSKAIIADSTNHALFTNRAMARFKLHLYEYAIADCNAAVELVGPNMKAHYIQAQCLLGVREFDDALKNARLALDLGIAKNDKSLTQLTTLVRECRRKRWEWRERLRRREGDEFEKELLDLMKREQYEIEDVCDDNEEKAAAAKEWQERAKLLATTFDKARTAAETRREVPDWLLDDITFDVLIDPVMTKTGQSYERASIMEALRRQPVDPLTREPLHPDDLRPNIALRKACEQFLDENGWAVDW
ncbi:U-box domain-containing protein [Xylaria intraflava]|nr:U-box domain-containing protein [Xylaria intraflava]